MTLCSYRFCLFVLNVSTYNVHQGKVHRSTGTRLRTLYTLMVYLHASSYYQLHAWTVCVHNRSALSHPCSIVTQQV
jgi:cellulose synthase/poly-beta-1,6-N-acetylglucosamine synthase-like glycosyltransferase